MGKSVPPSERSRSVPAPAGDAASAARSGVFPGGSQRCLPVGERAARVGTRFAHALHGVVYAGPRMVVDAPPL
jgi:hypothetical protein